VAVELSAADFSTDQLEAELASREETQVRVALSPGMKAGQIRLVLTWNQEPEDLDAHLEGPLPGEERFHVYFQEKGDLKSREFVSLDVDDRDGEGPETITVLGVLPGVYHYFVHDYTNRDDMQNTALSHSGGEVKLYQGGQTYRFKTNNRSVGTIWHVCDIQVDESGAMVRRIDEYEAKAMQTVRTGTVVLLIDSSGSMSGLMETTKQASYDFLDAVPFETGGQAGLVTFGDDTRALSQITNDRDLLQRAIAPLTSGGNTPMARGLEIAHGMLREVEGTRAMVVFTDGEPDDSARTLAVGRQVKDGGIAIWAIGTAGADMELLRQLVSSPEMAMFASPDDLRAIFGAAAHKIYQPVDDNP
jgi:uncharacterized protein YegL